MSVGFPLQHFYQNQTYFRASYPIFPVYYLARYSWWLWAHFFNWTGTLIYIYIYIVRAGNGTIANVRNCWPIGNGIGRNELQEALASIKLPGKQPACAFQILAVKEIFGTLCKCFSLSFFLAPSFGFPFCFGIPSVFLFAFLANPTRNMWRQSERCGGSASAWLHARLLTPSLARAWSP